MGFQLKLLGFWYFLVLTLSLCHGKNVTVKVVGVVHCTNCTRNEFSSSQATSDIKVSIHCKSKNDETNTQASGQVDKEGNFNVTLSAEFTNDDKSIDGCFAKLQSTSPDPCPIQTAQTASVKLLSIEKNVRQAQNKPTVIKFSPVTCQSAFFWPFLGPNITFFPTFSPPPRQPPQEYAPPPSEALSPLAPPVQSPVPPVVDPVPPPAQAPELPYSPPVSSLPPPQSSPDPTFKNSPPPCNEPIPTPTPKITPVAPPPKAFYQTPSVPPTPILSPTSPPPQAFHQTPSAPPTPILSPTPPPQKQPNPKTPVTPAAPVFAPFTPPKLENPISSPPNGRKPSPIPKAPPVPQLPPIPTVPRKYFNSPKSRSEPPRSS